MREAQVQVRDELRRPNRYDPAAGTLVYSDGRIHAFEELRKHYVAEVLDRQLSGGAGLGPHAIADPEESRKITAFIAWTAWTAAAHAPGTPHSYTNNWPPEPLVGNHLTQEAVVWSTLSIIALLGGIGLAVGAVRALFGDGGLARRRRTPTRLPPAGRVWRSPRRSAHGPAYFFIVAALFLVQTLLGGATAHYHAETGGFFGIDLAQIPAL